MHVYLCFQNVIFDKKRKQMKKKRFCAKNENNENQKFGLIMIMLVLCKKMKITKKLFCARVEVKDNYDNVGPVLLKG